MGPVIPSSPHVDSRTAADVAAQLRSLQTKYLSPWPQDRASIGAGEALIQICSRYAELIISRLNRVPGKNFLAFLDLFGVSPVPLRSARVPLTFTAVANAPEDVVVPARTQVAAQPAPGETSPVVYETEHELVVSRAKVESVFVKNPVADEFGDYSIVLKSLLVPESTREVVELFPAFRGSQPIRHVLYSGIRLPGNCSSLNTLRLSFLLEQSAVDTLDPRTLQWELVTAPLP